MGLGVGALRKLRTLHIGAAVLIFIIHDIVHIAQTGPQGHFSVGPQRGRVSSPPGPPPCARHCMLDICTVGYFRLLMALLVRVGLH